MASNDNTTTSSLKLGNAEIQIPYPVSRHGWYVKGELITLILRFKDDVGVKVKRIMEQLVSLNRASNAHRDSGRGPESISPGACRVSTQVDCIVDIL